MPPKVPEVIHCDSELDLQRELARIHTALTVPETEESWDALSDALLRITALCKGGACDYASSLTSSLRSMSRSISSAASSERSRLSAAATECISVVASGLGGDFESLVSFYLPTLLALCSRPNKVFVARSRTAIRTVIEQTQLPSVLPFLVDALKDKSVSMRLIAIESIFFCLNSLNPPDLEKESRARDIEKAIKQTATDASGDVRKVSRKVFDAYKILLPDRVESFTSPMSPIMRKYLNVKLATATTSASNSRPPSAQSNLSSRSSSRPASAMATATKRNDPAPRPATSMAHGRSVSTSTLPSTITQASSSKLSGTVALSRSLPSAAPTSRGHAEVKKPDVTGRKTAMGPPTTIPQRRPPSANQPTSSSTSISERVPTRAEPQRILRGPVAPTATVDRPDAISRLHPGPPLPPGRVEASHPAGRAAEPVRPSAAAVGQPMTIKEKLMGNVRRIPPPEPKNEVEKEVPSSNNKPPVPSSSEPVAGPSVRPRTTSKLAPATKPAPASAAAPPPIPSSSSDVTKTSKRGGITQPTLSQLARMKASEQDKKTAVKGLSMKLAPPKPLTIRAKARSGAPPSFKSSTRPKTASTDTRVEVAAAVPLPPSPRSTAQPTLVPLSPSPVDITKDIEEARQARQKVGDDSCDIAPAGPSLIVSASSITPVKDDATSMTPAFQDVGKTPISALVSSIQRGFLFTPNSPLSPPQSYAVSGEGGPWTFTARPRGMGAFGQALPVIQDEPSFEGVTDSSPKRSVDESGELYRPALVEMN